MSSLLAWLDTSPTEQKAAREIIAYFSERESRDELGIGQIRDALGDLLFPGTSTLHTRARYFLFIPWCYLARNAQRQHGGKHREVGRKNERKLIESLRTSETTIDWGIIGGRVGPSIKTLPSTVYWNAMRAYGIRTFSGGIGTLSADSFDQMDELAARLPTEWDAGMPEVPPGFPHEIAGGMDLTAEEASWLRDRIITSNPHSLLAALLEEGSEISTETRFPWEAAPRDEFPELGHAYWFSNVMYGAALVYNLAIAEMFEQEYPESDQNYVEDYRQRLEEWQEDFLFPNQDGIADWNRSDFTMSIRSVNPAVAAATWNFVNAWTDGVLRTSGVADDERLRQLVRTREARKGKQSRLRNSALRKNWSGASGAGQLTFRWTTVRTLVNDIVQGLDGAQELNDAPGLDSADVREVEHARA
ncbi:DUF6361 family protein [Brevibacterium oceani]|uniref:DUF6361 family protein n=1 Tax=Brevibacterium oceani TaxID=358099 RepID=UPI001B33F755|nr:DUF6361 family protein [Brevibacterium oceani]